MIYGSSEIKIFIMDEKNHTCNTPMSTHLNPASFALIQRLSRRRPQCRLATSSTLPLYLVKCFKPINAHKTDWGLERGAQLPTTTQIHTDRHSEKERGRKRERIKRELCAQSTKCLLSWQSRW